jgi:pyruvate-ferredoxin/flavodoxin oxidoreductase
MSRKMVTIDGNTAVAHVAHATNEVMTIYPITPSSNMAEYCDIKSAAGEKNLWGTIPSVFEMQSEAGAAGAVHGALQAGTLTTTFTASQGLLLMIPNMYKIAGELTSTVFHISARAISAAALNIFGDHSDVMSCRSTGWAMLCANNVQEVMDFALIAQSSTLRARVPFIHFFDGFRTSHELQKVEALSFDDMRALVTDDLVNAHRARSMSPDRPIIRGTSQNPDVYFQGRETVNPFYAPCLTIVQEEMDKLGKLTGRNYKIVEYEGAADADRVIVVMGTGADTTVEAANALNAKGEKVGVVKIRLYRPFPTDAFLAALPKTVKKISVLDRTKEPGSIGEPLYLDVCATIATALTDGTAPFTTAPVIVGGRYGLGSKEYTPAMAKAVFDNLNLDKPKRNFVVGITEDVMNSSLAVDANFRTELADTYQAMFFGLGSDGTVGANKNTIKIIGEATNNYAQAYFVYDSKKAGSITTSHLRFGKKPINAPYLIDHADFVACHNFSFLEKYDMLSKAKEGATFLLCSPFEHDEVWDKMPVEVQQQIIDKKVKFFVINAVKLGEEIGLGARINMIMQAAFFKISNIIPIETAVDQIKYAIKKSYGKAGDKVVNMNYSAVDAGLNNIHEVKVPATATSSLVMPPAVPAHAPQFVQEVTAMLIAGKGEDLPVSAMPIDGTFPTATSQYEKRNIANDIPVWDEKLCIQCGICSFLCPHAAIRVKAYPASALEGAPATFKCADSKMAELKDMKVTFQVAPEDCTGCGACAYNCPAKDKANPNHKALDMAFQPPLRAPEAANYEFFLNLPEVPIEKLKLDTLRGSQLVRPLFEYSGACAGCGETAYLKLLTQLFGDRLMMGNATGCSSIYGGNLPTTPYAKRADGRGPTWNNSLFEDCAEFSLGLRLGVDKFKEAAYELVDELMADAALQPLLKEIKEADQKTQVGIEAQRARVAKLNDALKGNTSDAAKKLIPLTDYLVNKSVWAIGGDGWAYDIGYGGLDHVIASGKNINLLVLDTEVYSNTGGQASKSTPMGAVAQFAAGGKPVNKKDLGLIAMSYGNVYVASVSQANPGQCVKAFMEAEAHDGPSLIIAYSHCIAHGINMTTAVDEQKKAVSSGYLQLYRYNPALAEAGKNPLQIDSKPATTSYEDFVNGENRWKVLKKVKPEEADKLAKRAAALIARRNKLYQQMATLSYEV